MCVCKENLIWVSVKSANFLNILIGILIGNSQESTP